ncbi:MAG TPA: 6-phosphogluconolactonase [Tepidisphaeraceae bacterium]|jgi:6-phosphogluconolactonase|nr:6-phosphogluconolactonase [Tepidisphaeraceae bacterium]
MEREIKVVPDMTELVREAADRITDAARRAVAEKGRFSIALSGGRTPEGLYQLLASEPYRSAIDWGKVEVYFGDERCVPPDSDQSNYRMANAALLSKVPIPAENVHRIRGEIDPNTAAIEYGQLLKQKFGDGGLDLTLLGMGDDGHTASLFPGTAALKETHHRAVANHVEKLNAWRVTMSAPFLNRSREVMFLISGADKAKRVVEVLEGPREPERLPIQLIEPTEGKVVWLLDAPAAGMHDDE